MILTKHGKKRIKQRVGLPKRAHKRHKEKVLQQGRYLSREGWEKFKMVYHGFLYVFAISNDLEPILVTAYPQESQKR